ncbi:MAG: LD-carboxypeptidase [Bacteroidales bacterium]|nr:LD-carboxypeptidase [Bacteroidales bacterium]MDD4683652.1 LD-carboxypeptidase [Bacteroidales bacterium]
MTKRPELLKKGDKIGIVATARKISIEEVAASIKLFLSWGLVPVIGKSIGEEENQFAGSDMERAKDLQSFLDNKEIKAVFCARGGYGTVRIIDMLDFSLFIQNPKWIIGYSDPTVLLSHIYFNYNIETIHGIMPLNINKDNFFSNAVISLKKILFEGENKNVYKKYIMNRKGEAEGDLIGGNLSVLYSLLGSNSFGETKGKILFIEDLDEYIYHIDRMMQALRRAGKLKDLKGLIVGGMTDMHDNAIPFGKTANRIIMDTVKEYNFPVAFNIPIGHIKEENQAYVVGRKTTLIVEKDKVIIEQ